MPAARSNSQCPYCDHQSPAGSKFCNDCGAALHLRPCPHCGSVNDISLTTLCSRCNGELGEASETVLEAEAAAATTVIAATPAPAPAPPAEAVKVSRAPLIALGLLAVAVGGYYGLRSEPAPTSPNLAAVEPPAPARPTLAVATVPPPVPVPAPAPAPEEASKTSAAVPALAASLAKLAPPSAGRASVIRRESAAPMAPTAAAPAAPPDRRSGAGLDLKQPQIGTCTDAVAALGLCTPDSTPRRP